MIWILLFCYVPIAGWILSVFDYRSGLSLFQCEFVGLKYFKMIFTDRNIPGVLKNTLIFSAIFFAISWLPMAFAILLNEIKSSRFRTFAQTMTTIPNCISWVILFSLMFSIISTDGMLNLLIKQLGGPDAATNFLADEKSVYIVQTLIGQWKGLGWSAIIYIAAIAGIDQEQYEAAMIDGANRFHCAWHITLPSILPTFVVMMLLNIDGILNTGYEQYFLFKNPMGGMIPTYLVYRSYGLLNSFWVYIIPSLVSAYNVILIKTYVEQLPASLEESAIIDGAGPIVCFVKIILPLCMPIVATIAIFSAVGQWNAWFDNHIYTFNNKDLTTMQYMLYVDGGAGVGNTDCSISFF